MSANGTVISDDEVDRLTRLPSPSRARVWRAVLAVVRRRSKARAVRLQLELDTTAPAWLAFLDRLGVYFAEQHLAGVAPRDTE